MDNSGAKQLRELVVSITGEHDEALQSFDAIIQGMQDSESAAQATNKALEDFSKGLATVSIALTAIGTLAVSAFAQFEQSVHNAGSVIGATQEQMERLATVARDAWDIPTFKAKESADAMYYLASAGYDTEQIIATMAGTLELAAATQSQLEFTSESVVSTLNQFELAATATDRVVNVLAATISFTQATLERMRESLKFVGPVASALGIELEQVSAALGIMYNSGIKAEQAGTSLRAGLLRLQAPTAAAISAMKRLGLTYDQLNPQTHDLISIIGTLEKAIGDDLASAGDELGKIFGVESVTAFQVLIRKGAEALAEMETRLTGTNKASEVAKIQLDTLQASLLTAARAVNELAIEFGSILAPVVKSLALLLKDLLMAFVQLPEILKNVIVFGSALTAVLTGIGAPVLFLVANLPKITAAWSAFIGLIGGSLAPIILTTAAVAALGYAIVKMVNQQQEEARNTKENIKFLESHYSARLLAIEAAEKSANTFIKLSQSGKAAAETESEMQIAVDKINAVYPSLISNTDDYATKVQKISFAANKAAIEVTKLKDSQLALEKIKVAIEIADTKKAINEAKTDLEAGLGSFEKFFSNKRAVSMNIKFADGLQTFEQIKSVSNQIIDTFTQMDPFTREIKLNGAIISANGANLQSMAEKLAATETGREKILNDIQVLSQLELKATEGLLATQTKAKEEARELNKEEEISVRAFTAQKESAAALQNTYTEVLKKAAALAELQQTLSVAENKRAELMKGLSSEIPKPKPASKKPHDDTNAFSERELEKQKQLAIRRAEFERDLQQKTLEAKLSLERDTGQKTIALQVQQIQKEFETRKQLLGVEKQRQLAIAESIGYDKLKVEESFASQLVTLEEQKYNEISKIQSQYLRNQEEIRMLQMDLEFDRGLDDLEGFKTFLYTKLSILEEWSDEYVYILRAITDVEGKENEKRKRASQSWANTTMDMVESVGIAMEGTFRKGMTGVWKEALDAVVDTLANHYKNILKMDLEVAMALQQWGRVAKDLIGIAAISALASASKASIARARVGASVVRDGAAIVHQGETIVPAKVVRRSQEYYQNANNQMIGRPNNHNQPAMPNIIVQVNNPMVGNQNFWNTIFQEHILESMYQYNKRVKTT